MLAGREVWVEGGEGPTTAKQNGKLRMVYNTPFAPNNDVSVWGGEGGEEATRAFQGFGIDNFELKARVFDYLTSG